MWVLDKSTKSFIAKTLVAPVSPLTFNITYKTKTQKTETDGLSYHDSGEITETYSQIVTPPYGTGIRKNITCIQVNNPNVTAHTVVVSLYDSSGAVTTPIFRGYLKQGWCAEYNVDTGWKVYNDKGTDASITSGVTTTITPKVLGQSNPSATTLTTLYTVPASTTTECTSISVCNRSAVATTFRIAVRPGGAAISNEHYIYYDVLIAGNDTFLIENGLFLETTDVISVYAGAATLSFNLYGKETV